MKLFKQVLTLLLCFLLLRFTAQAESFGPTGQSSEQQQPPPAQQSLQELQQLVAPIALYPDALVAQILAASTYPTEIVEADRWMQQHSSLKGEELAQAVNKESWDPSVKALTQFPSVLANMDKDLSWASALGDAYVNQQKAVLDAVQTMRKRAQQAGNLKTTPQETVATQGQTIVIEPANPEVVYVPSYDPWLVYGPPLVAYPGWVPLTGVYAVGPGISFGLGFHGDPGFHGGQGFHGGEGFHGGPAFHGGPGPAAVPGFHGSGASHVQSGTHSGAFSGFDHGGVAKGFSGRGQSSFGGGFHGGGVHAGGGFHGGGSHGGG